VRLKPFRFRYENPWAKTHGLRPAIVKRLGFRARLLSLDYEVYLVEELLFSSSSNVGSAVARLLSKPNQHKGLFIKDILLWQKLVWSLPDCFRGEWKLNRRYR
jgi:hypothetical protein